MKFRGTVALLSVLALQAPNTGHATTFPIGLWEGLTKPTDCPNLNATALDEIRGGPSYGYSSGFNVVHSFWHFDNYTQFVSYPEMSCFLDLAQSYGMKVLVRIPEFTATQPCPTLWHTANYALATDIIAHVKSHPNTYGYYIADEPQDIYGDDQIHATPATELSTAFNALKSNADNTHPYLISLPDYSEDWPGMTGGAWPPSSDCDWRWNNVGPAYAATRCGTILNMTQDYSSASDMVIYDTFVHPGLDDDPTIPDNSNRKWCDWLAKLDDLVLHTSQDVHALLWADLGDLYDTATGNITGYTNYWNALRLQTYTSIIHGAKGIWYFSYHTAYVPKPIEPGPIGSQFYTEAPMYYKTTVAPLSSELAVLEGALVGPTVGQTWTDTSLSCGGTTHITGVNPSVSAPAGSKFHWILKYDPETDSNTLIVANATKDARTATFNLGTLPQCNAQTAPALSATTAEVMFESDRASHAIAISAHSFADTFGPWEVHVYQLGDARLVPEEYPTIYAALVGVTPGERISVAPGTYSAFFTLPVGVTIVARQGGAAPVLDGYLGGALGSPTVTFPAGADRATVLDGFTVLGASNPIVALAGQGVLRNCVVNGTPYGSSTAVTATGSAGSVIDNCQLSASSFGVDATGSVDISGSTITGGSGAGGAGIRAGNASANVVIDDALSCGGVAAQANTVTGRTGILVAAGAVTAKAGTVTNCVTGVDVAGGYASLGQGDASGATSLTVQNCSSVGVSIASASASNTLTQCRIDGVGNAGWIGVLLGSGTNATMTRCIVQNATGSSAVGIKIMSAATLLGNYVSGISPSGTGAGILVDTDDTKTIVIDRASVLGTLERAGTVQNCYYGIKVNATARPKVRYQRIYTNTNDVWINGFAQPDLGQPYDYGNNCLSLASYSCSDALKLMAVKTPRLGSLPSVPAEGNYWGQATPLSCDISSFVDYAAAQSTCPSASVAAPVSPLVDLTSPAKAPRSPSVVQRGTEFEVSFEASTDDGTVEAAVYDAGGRRVSTAQARVSANEIVAVWDGNYEGGQRARSGVYFVRVHSQRLDHGAKVVVLR